MWCELRATDAFHGTLSSTFACCLLNVKKDLYGLIPLSTHPILIGFRHGS